MSNVPPPPLGDVPPDPFGNQAPAHRDVPSSPAPPPPPATAPPHLDGVPTAPQIPAALPTYGAPDGYQPYGAGAPFDAAPPKSGMLLAGGIVAVILAVFTILVGLAIALLGSAFSGLDGNIGASIALLGLGVAAFGAFGLVSGIGAIMRRQWGRICSIVFGGVNSAFALLALVSEPDGGGVVYLAISATIVGLCVGGPASPA